MAFAETDDGVKLYYEEVGAGTPILFIHEFAGDLRSWKPQLRAFARRYRCIAYNARGFPPSEVPEDVAMYSQARAVEDAAAVLDHLGIDTAHIVGLSMGGFATLHFGICHPNRARSLLVGGCGYGAEQDRQSGFRSESERTAESFETLGAPRTAERYALGPARVQFQNKDPRGWAEFAAQLAEHSAKGSALTLRGVQMHRPSLYDITADLERLSVPTLIVTGDEDEGCLDADLMLKRRIRSSSLAVIPGTGHACNLEEPDVFNLLLSNFLATVDAGRWARRDPRSLVGGLTGMRP